MRIKRSTLDLRLWELHITHGYTGHGVSSASLPCLVVDTPPRLQCLEGRPGRHRVCAARLPTLNPPAFQYHPQHTLAGQGRSAISSLVGVCIHPSDPTLLQNRMSDIVVIWSSLVHQEKGVWS